MSIKLVAIHTNIKAPQREPWNKDKLVGQKAPLKLKEIWSIRIRLELSHRIRELALFNLAIDSKLRACDLVKLKLRDISHGNQITSRAIILQQKTGKPVHFEIMESTRKSIYEWIQFAGIWVGHCQLWYTYHEAHQSYAYLQTNKKPKSNSIAAWPYQIG